MASRSVRSTNREDQSPLLEQCAIGREHRVAWIIDTGRFRCGAIKLDDLEIAPLLKVFLILVTNVVSPNKEAGQLLGNLVDCTLQRVRVQMHPISKNAALRVIAGFNQFQNLARRQNLISPKIRALFRMFASVTTIQPR
jgi:hypothetical protein